MLNTEAKINALRNLIKQNNIRFADIAKKTKWSIMYCRYQLNGKRPLTEKLESAILSMAKQKMKTY